ncbi:MAG: hypothetical protein JSR80_05980 [Verrucomicrobia bacterium]|nr:hypothetical protein [Verrucomicrobiota bacterium]
MRSVTESFLWGLATAGITFAVVRRFTKLEGWRRYLTVGAAGAVGALISSVLLNKSKMVEVDRDPELLAQLSQGWLGRFNAGKELSVADKTILAQIQKFRPQWFDVLDEDKIVPLIKLLPNLKVLSFQRSMTKEVKGFADLNALVDELFSEKAHRSPLPTFVPSSELLKALSQMNLQALTCAQQRCLDAVKGFCVIDLTEQDEMQLPAIQESEKDLATLLPHLKNLEWLNLSAVSVSSPLFNERSIGHLKRIKDLVLQPDIATTLLNKCTGQEQIEKEVEDYLSLCSLVGAGSSKLAVKILQIAPHLRDLMVQLSPNDEESNKELLRLLQQHPEVRFQCLNVLSILQSHPEGIAAEIIRKRDISPLKLTGSQQDVEAVGVLKLRNKSVVEVELTLKTCRTESLQQAYSKSMEKLMDHKCSISHKPLTLQVGEDKYGIGKIVKTVIDDFSPSSLTIESTFGHHFNKENLQDLKASGYEIRAQNYMSREICALDQTGVEEWEEMTWETLEEQALSFNGWIGGDIFTFHGNLKGSVFSIVFVKK